MIAIYSNLLGSRHTFRVPFDSCEEYMTEQTQGVDSTCGMWWCLGQSYLFSLAFYFFLRPLWGLCTFCVALVECLGLGVMLYLLWHTAYFIKIVHELWTFAWRSVYVVYGYIILQWVYMKAEWSCDWETDDLWSCKGWACCVVDMFSCYFTCFCWGHVSVLLCLDTAL